MMRVFWSKLAFAKQFKFRPGEAMQLCKEQRTGTQAVQACDSFAS